MAVEDDKKLVADYAAHPARLRPILALWDVSRDWLLWRLEGVTDEEWLWEPGPRPWTVRKVDGRWRRDSVLWGLDPAGTVRTLAWSAGHLGEMCAQRADWTTGTRSLGDNVEWPGTAAEGVSYVRDGLDAWRATLGEMSDADLDQVGRSTYPDGFDPEVPFLDVAWWNARELVHHSADMSVVRDLYAQQ